MQGRIARLIVFLAAAAALALAGAPPSSSPLAWLSLPLAYALLAWAPGEALLALLRGSRPLTDPVWSWAAPLALGPVVAGTTVIMADLAGLPFSRAAWAPVALTGLMILASTARRTAPAGPTRSVDDPAPASAVDYRRVLALALGLAAVIAVVELVNPWLRWRADGRFHIGVVEEISRGGLPPTDPFFAGVNLQYMWFFHAFAAAVRSLGGGSTAAQLALINVTMVATVVLLLWEFGRGMGRPAGAALLGAALVVLAMGGHGWIFLPVRLLGVFTGADRGWPALASIIDIRPQPIGRSQALFSILLDEPFFLRKFLVGTAMSTNLAVLFLHLELSRRAIVKSAASTLALIALTAAGCIVLHPMMGIPAVAAVCAATGLLFLRGLRRPPEGGAPGFGATAAIVAANAAGALLSLPYLRLVTSGKEGAAGFPVDFVPMKIASLVLGTIVMIVAAGPWLWRRLVRPADGSRLETWAAAWAVVMTGFAFFVRFPLERENIDKPTLLTHIALAMPAGWVLWQAMKSGSARRGALVRWLVVLIVVPMNLVVLGAYVMERDPRTYRPHEKEAFEYVRRNAPVDALVIDSQDRDRPGVEITRRMFWSHEQFMATHEYPKKEVDARRAVRDDLYSGGGPGEESLARLRATGVPVYVIVRAGAAAPGAGYPAGRGPVVGSFAAGATDPLSSSTAFDRVFDRDDVRVYRLR